MYEKHNNSQHVAMNNLGKFFPPWTVPRDFWLAALHPDVAGVAVNVRLFHDSGCRLVHKYPVYRDPFHHPALRGRVMNKLLALVARTMAIAQLTQLHITIPASGSVAEAVPEDCFPPVPLPRALVSSRRVSFASEVTILGTAPESSADRKPTSLCRIFRLMNRSTHCFLRRIPWTLLLWFRNWTFRCFLPRRVSIASSGRGPLRDRAAPLPRLTYLRTCRDGSRWGFHVLPVIRRRCRFLRFPVTPRKCRWSGSRMVVSDPPSGTTGVLDVLLGSPLFDLLRPTTTSSSVASSGVPDCPASRDLRGSPAPVPRWRLAWEGPFLNERWPSALNCFSDGCSFRHTGVSLFGPHSAIWKAWCSVASSPIFNVDWHTRVCQSSGNGPGEVAPFFVAGTGY